MRSLIAVALILTLGQAHGATSPAFQYENVLSIFEQIRSTPGFDPSNPLQWGFFFVSGNRTPLQLVREELEAQGYTFISEHQDKTGRFWIQMSRVEVHTPGSLHKRNAELLVLAAKYGNVEYDGWDVGKITSVQK